MKICNLSYQHHSQAPFFFKDLSLEITSGKLHALHGKNGLGKSILLNILNRTPPSQAIIQGKIIGGERAILINQRFDLMIADQFSFLENLQFACMANFPSPFSSLKSHKHYLDLAGTFHIDVSKPVSKLSGGQRQILALLMVLQRPYNFLMLDEPTAALDEENAVYVFDFLKELTKKNITLLVVCHDKELTDRYVDGNHFRLEMNKDGLRKLS